MTKPVTLMEFREDELLKLLEMIAKREGVHIDLDQAQLEKQIGKRLDQVTVEVPRGRLPLGAALELIAEQLHGTVEVKAGQCRIVPGAANIARFVTPVAAGNRRAIRILTEIEKPIHNAAAKDVFEFLSEKYNVRVIASSGLVGKTAKFCDRKCSLAPGRRLLIEVVEDVAEQTSGSVWVFQEMILVTPRVRGES